MGDQTNAETADQTFTASDVAAAKDEGIKAGAEQATTRIKTILTCDEAEGRGAQAQTIALSTSMSAEEAAALLAASPKETTQTTVKTIEERAEEMEELGNSDPTTSGAKTPLTDLAKGLNKEAS